MQRSEVSWEEPPPPIPGVAQLHPTYKEVIFCRKANSNHSEEGMQEESQGRDPQAGLTPTSAEWEQSPRRDGSTARMVRTALPAARTDQGRSKTQRQLSWAGAIHSHGAQAAGLHGRRLTGQMGP